MIYDLRFIIYSELWTYCLEGSKTREREIIYNLTMYKLPFTLAYV